MLITFTTEHGNLVIRAEDLRRLEDMPDGGTVAEWTPNGEGLHFQRIKGSATENAARIVQQEQEVIAAYERAQRDDLRYTRDGKLRPR